MQRIQEGVTLCQDRNEDFTRMFHYAMTAILRINADMKVKIEETNQKLKAVEMKLKAYQSMR